MNLSTPPGGLAALIATIAVIAGTMTLSGASVEAAPALQARNLVVGGQSCTAQGTVRVAFVWDSSNRGTQWFDISRLSNFAAWGNQGPLSSQTEGTTWTLDSNTTYYARISTFEPQGLTRSNTLQFRTVSCAGAFSPPDDIDADVFDDFVRISWDKGNGNLFSCVDTARSQSDLLNQRNTWRNWGCGTTGTQLDLTRLACGATYYYRIWATSSSQSGHSEVDSFVTEDCQFTPPSDPQASLRTDTSIQVSWDSGLDNHFFCIDLALTQSDLMGLTGSWFNAACGTTGTSAVVAGLQCGRQYHYRIWAAGTEESGYSEIDTISTPACDFEAPDDLEVEVEGEGQVVFSWDEEDAALWFCVDVAGSESDLVGFTDSWRNFDCGGTDEGSEVTNDYFECGETYFWRVYAFAGSASGYSEVESFLMDC